MKLVLLLPALLSLPFCAFAESPAKKSADEQVMVYWHKLQSNARPVPWKLGLTVDEAIRSAAGSPAREWQQAWRLRETFWSRFFHRSKTVSVLTVRRGETPARALLRPGDTLCVDIAPIL